MLLSFLKTMLITITGIGTMCFCSILIGATALVVVGIIVIIIMILKEAIEMAGDE